MDIIEAIKSRKSIRDFKSDPVSKEIINEILELASNAPSAMNTQPWEFIVITGDVLEKVREGNIERLNSGAKPNPEHKVVGWTSDSIYRRRQVDLAIQLFKLMGIQREDKEKRAQWMQRGFRYFNAPAAILMLTDRALSEAGPLMDIGGAMQTICLAAMSHGLGTCIEDQGVMYPETIRNNVDIPDSKKIMIAIAIGYPNWDFPANEVNSSREPVENTTTWFGF